MKPRYDTFYSFSVALFLYATLIVDLYRKIVGYNVNAFRNGFYIITFVFILIDIVKSKHTVKMFVIALIFSLLYLLSNAINPGYDSIFLASWFLFISRLWPAYYIGRYTEDWDAVACHIRRLVWLAVIYTVIAIYGPHESESNAYATIATNLSPIAFLSIYSGIKERKWIGMAAGFFCMIPVLFFGTRACLFGALLSFILLYPFILENKSHNFKRIVISITFLVIVLIIFGFTVFSDYLLDLFPNSRSLKMLVKGDIMNDSNRTDGFYYKIFEEISDSPLKIHGFIGDRIYLAGAGATDYDITSSFSHNVLLELCLNFGVVIGALAGLYFMAVLFIAIVRNKYDRESLRFLFLSTAGITFVNMMVSASYLGYYSIWLMYGLAYHIINKNKESVDIQFSSQTC